VYYSETVELNFLPKPGFSTDIPPPSPPLSSQESDKT